MYYEKDKPVEYKIFSNEDEINALFIMFSRGQYPVEVNQRSIQAIGTKEDLVKEFKQDVFDCYAMRLSDYFKEINKIVYDKQGGSRIHTMRPSDIS